MVKVTGLSDREVALREKTSRLVEITEQVLGSIDSQRVETYLGNIHIKRYSTEAPGYGISITPRSNLITVESKPYFNEAMALAEAYETAFPEEREFEVKRLYEEATTS
ncbi:MAG TPA: hypothetical protein ENH99_00580 [Candidatus Pacearchaeota archaeon]|nr:hypothetical protein [Candidatus Pacearchaeota archaeon]